MKNVVAFPKITKASKNKSMIADNLRIIANHIENGDFEFDPESVSIVFTSKDRNEITHFGYTDWRHIQRAGFDLLRFAKERDNNKNSFYRPKNKDA